MIFCILRDNYVVNRIVADAMPTDYPYPHDTIIEDVDQCIFIGDWYEASEGIFYRPMGVPVDWPDELKPPATDGQG